MPSDDQPTPTSKRRVVDLAPAADERPTETPAGDPPSLEQLLDEAMSEADATDVGDDWADEIEDAPWAKDDDDLAREEMEREMMRAHLRGAGQLHRGDPITGTVVHVGASDIFVDIGGKSEAVLDAAELRDADEEISVKPGDTLTLYVADITGEGVRLSYKMALEARSREAVRAAYAERVPIEGRITSSRKGGYEVRFQSGQRAFLPLSQVDLRHVPDDEIDDYVGKTYEFLVTKYESDGKDLVVSRAQLLREERETLREQLRETLEVGQIREGTVSRIVDFGAFVDLGGIDGLVHVSEIAWGRTERPQDRLRPGETVKVKVLRIDRAKGTVSLSIKETEASPWDGVGTDFVEGGVYPGTVRRLEAFGAFVELIPGLEGLVHVSELSWERVRHPDAIVQPGDRVTVKLIRVEPDKRRLGLSLKQVGGDPWQDVAAGWMRGQLLEGTVDKVAPFGVLVRLAPGVSGLIPFGDLGMDQAQAHLAYNPGKTVTVEVGDVDLERRRVRLLPSDEDARGEREALQSYAKEKAGSGLGTLGDLLGNLKIDG